VEYKYIFFNIT